MSRLHFDREPVHNRSIFRVIDIILCYGIVQK